MNMFADNKEFDTLMNEFIKKELFTVRYGEETKLTPEEIDEWKPIYFEGSGTWGADVESGAPFSFYEEGKWQLTSATTKRRVYHAGVLRPKCRNELYYGVLGKSGEIPVDFHKHFNHLVRWWNNYKLSHSCSNCGHFVHPSSSTCGCGWEY